MKRVMRINQRGFTLIEALVVVFVIGLLLALVLPAVQSARESARRLTCTNQLRQLGIALSHHHEQWNSFPSAVSSRWRLPGGHVITSDLPGLYNLLPFLEQSVLFNEFNITINEGALIVIGLAQNQTAKAVRVATFLCPSDSMLPTAEPGPNSYRFNVGSWNYPFEQNTGDYLGKGAAFAIGKKLSASNFTDGLSQTVGMSERISGSGSTVSFDRTRDFWYANVIGLISPQKADQIMEICGALTSVPSDYNTTFGYSWCWPSYAGTWYNHVGSPNSIVSDCSLEKSPIDPSNIITQYGLISARSFHTGGVNSLMMDGSVSFVKSGIDRFIWRALGTRSGGDLITGDSY
jgi:prepilin-type N-terminal cleavage/methylation domain-containing protein/prepilin-type processing-associated H-X9-DG protein